ncbi:HAD family hydrolase [Brasilonema octagenarum]|uniref:Uncharacterized protein n=1 Tax=Brasilonema octagenarum UFV-OR1 TaxID=417115 RepID=A0ABX1M165_9CYAN|nr:HAD hydrolase-like protein [Brasilonema octagenarum]NMF62224.1 hypothetical protein [Brasilonema octagenarum UFV-OR1]
MKKTVYSFDVFETSLVRIWAKPTDLFWELGEQLRQQKLIEISADTWQQMRIKAESAARVASKTGEVTVEQIYQQLAGFLSWSTTQAQQAMHKEIALELASLRPVPAIQKRIQALQQANERVIYISDMYLSEETIRTFLKENNVWTPGSRLYVSSEVGVSKANGKLFQHCLAKESVKASQLNHIGDNLHSDVKMAKKQGVRVEPISQTHLNRYEQIIANDSQLPLPFRSQLAGMSRLTRLHSKETSPNKQIIWDTTANVIAPMLFGYVYWCLVSAKKRGIKRLYFVARDGQILHKIAQEICRNWGYEIDCRYLYGSRQAWHAPSLMQVGEDEYTWIFNDTTFLSVHSVCERVNITPEQIEDVLARFGFAKFKWNHNLSRQERNQLKLAFREPEVVELIVATATSYREQAIGYFRQEQIGDGLPFAVVDIGWTGRSLGSFSKVLKSAGLYPESGMHGFYFALEKRVKAFASDQLLTYFYDGDKPVGDRDRICQYRCLFELFVAADHGGTARYEQQGDQYTPVLRYQKNQAAINWGLYVLQNAAVEFAKQLTTNLSEQDCPVELFIRATNVLIEEFVQNPSFQEAKVFGSFLMAEDQGENKLYELAPAYSLIDCFRLILRGKQPHQNVWFPASFARSYPIFRIFMNERTMNMTHHLRVIGGKLRRGILLKRLSEPA